MVNDFDVKVWPGQDLPAGVDTVVQPGEIVVLADHLVGRVTPPLDVIEDDLIGSPPVAGVDELPASEVLAEVSVRSLG